MVTPSQLDLQRAREVTHLYGGNGLSTTQSERLVAEKLAEWRAAILVEDAHQALLSAGQPILLRAQAKDPDQRDPGWVKVFPIAP